MALYCSFRKYHRFDVTQLRFDIGVLRVIFAQGQFSQGESGQFTKGAPIFCGFWKHAVDKPSLLVTCPRNFQNENILSLNPVGPRGGTCMVQSGCSPCCPVSCQHCHICSTKPWMGCKSRRRRGEAFIPLSRPRQLI